VEEDEDEEDEEKEEEDEDEEEDDCKEPRMIGQGDMADTSADDADAIVDVQPILLPGRGQEMCEHSPRPQPPAAAPPSQTLEPCP